MNGPAEVLRPGAGAVPPVRVLWLGAFATLRALGLVLVAEAIARGIAGLQDGAVDVRTVLILGVTGALLRAGAGWATQVSAQRIAVEVKRDLRGRLWRRVATDGLGTGARNDTAGGDAPRQGGFTVLASEGLDDLDDYYTQSLPAMIAAVATPVLVGLRILGADWVSAVIVVLTVPLIPVFMILIGQHTQQKTDEATGALTRLADHLTELARGLPVLVGLNRVEEQAESLDRIQRDYRRRTLGTLRTAFLSALALELIATLSVAVVAVFLGLRLLNGSVGLESALLALILAPEIYAALREVGAAFHASQSGRSALARVKELLGRPRVHDPRVIEPEESVQGARPGIRTAATAGPTTTAIRIRDLSVRYGGRTTATLTGLDAELHGITAVTGPSGSGKSTLLAALAGVLPADAETSGSIEGIGEVGWSPQAPRTFATTPHEELALYATSATRQSSRTEPGSGADAHPADAGGSAPLVAAVLHELGMEHLRDSDVAELSPGELRRLSVARALLRVDLGAGLLILDEPTAHLDVVAAEMVRAAIRRRVGRATMVLATHEPETLALADRRIDVASPGSAPSAAAGSSTASPPSTAQGVPADDPRHATDPGGAQEERSPLRHARDGSRILWRTLLADGWRWAGAVALGAVATMLGLALTGVSGWLIVRASEERYIMYLLVAIVGVRFFGLGRSVARYAESLATHDAAFRAVDALRLRLWRAIAGRGTGSRRLLGGGSPVDHLVSQANELRDQLPRTLPPLVVGALSITGIAVATAVVAPTVAPVVGATLATATLLGVLLAVGTGRVAARTGVRERSAIVRGTAALAAAADDLRGNGPPLPAAIERNSGRETGTSAPASTALARLDVAADRLARAELRGAWSAGLGLAVATLATSLLAISLAPLSGASVAPEHLAVVALLAMAALDPVSTTISAAHRLPALRETADRLAPVLRPVPAALTGDRAMQGPIRSLRIEGLAARYPQEATGPRHPLDDTAHGGDSRPGTAEVFTGVDGGARRGEWLIVDGPSGSGKSTLLSVLMGALAPSSGRIMVNETPLRDLDAAAWRGHVAWCPQEAHVFDSTLRGNLLLSRPHHDAPDDADMRGALEAAGLGPLLDELPEGLGARVGPAGTALSGGERQRLAVARALLSRADVLLLDEPTAHLDEPTAHAMMTDIRAASSGRITVLVSHRAADRHPDDRIIRLDDAPVPATA